MLCGSHINVFFSNVQFDNVTVRYGGPDSTPVLDGVSFHVPPGASIGIVGRTGAGKSTLISCLLRLVSYSGTIRIDGLDIHDLDMKRVRESYCVVPQEGSFSFLDPVLKMMTDPFFIAVLFSGTVRENIDPLGMHLTDEVNSVLREVDLSIDDLDAPVPDLSLGERQLLCICRAMLQSGKIVLQDEATASVDTESDRKIQNALAAFLNRSNLTSFVIAHRLQTVMASDMVLVLDQGRVMEIGRPSELLLEQGGAFRALVDETGRQSSMHLTKMATTRTMDTFSKPIDERPLLPDWIETEFELFQTTL